MVPLRDIHENHSKSLQAADKTCQGCTLSLFNHILHTKHSHYVYHNFSSLQPYFTPNFYGLLWDFTCTLSTYWLQGLEV